MKEDDYFMICKNCGEETSTVFCSNCGVNVVWFNKYGILQKENSPEKFIDINTGEDESDNVEDIVTEIFTPDGSGD